jgi:hypothetical protein
VCTCGYFEARLAQFFVKIHSKILHLLVVLVKFDVQMGWSEDLTQNTDEAKISLSGSFRSLALSFSHQSSISMHFFLATAAVVVHT